MKSWYFPVIWEAVTQSDFEGDFVTLALQIGLTLSEVQSAFKILLDQGLVRKNDLGGWTTDREQASTVNLNFTTDELRRLQVQLFMHQVRAINDIPFELRDHSTIFISGGSDVIDEVKKRINLFRRSLANYIEKSGGLKSHQQIYQLSIGFSPTLKK